MINTIQFSAVVALVLCYILLLTGMLAAAAMRGIAWRRRAKISAVVLPGIRDALIDYASGSNDLTRLREFASRHRADLADAMLSFQDSLAGTALERICGLSLEFKLVQEWIDQSHSRDPLERRAAFARLAFVSAYEPCRRLTAELLERGISDPDSEVRFVAARAQLHSGDPAQAERVFNLALAENLMGRVLLAEALRRQAVKLCERAVPDALRASNPSRIAAALEMLVAWQRAIPLDDLRDLLEHCDSRVRLRAIRLAPLVPLSGANQASMITALEDPDPALRLAAARAVGQLHMTEALPALARCVRMGSARVARTAASALAGMPRLGWQTLEELSTRPDQVTSAAAREALARLQQKVTL